MKNNILITLILIFSLNILGCSPAGILASGGATGMVVAEGDRSFGSVVDDATIKINIAAKFINSDDNLFVDVSTSVLEGRASDFREVLRSTNGLRSLLREMQKT